jgi:hypothetical protein
MLHATLEEIKTTIILQHKKNHRCIIFYTKKIPNHDLKLISYRKEQRLEHKKSLVQHLIIGKRTKDATSQNHNCNIKR